ncbi:MAG: hypothetical protein J7501_11380 [Bdellovibrio sp.]|nr:hypothetical protein [Bdellovibrio sp.]
MDRMDSMNRLDNVRKGLKENDDLELPMNEDFFNKLHDKIMAEVEQVEIAPAPVMMRPRNILRAHWRGWLYPVGGVMSVLLMSTFMIPHLAKVNEGMQRAGLASDGRERIVMEALLSPDEISQTLISSQTESDFLVDVASESSENFRIAKLKITGDSAH